MYVDIHNIIIIARATGRGIRALNITIEAIYAIGSMHVISLDPDTLYH